MREGLTSKSTDKFFEYARFGRGFERGESGTGGKSRVGGGRVCGVGVGEGGPAEWLDKSQCSAYALGAALYKCGAYGLGAAHYMCGA